MEPKQAVPSLVRTGDLDGLGRVYSVGGGLIMRSGEEILKTADGWDANISSPWRRILPKIVFEGFRGKTASKLFVTTERILLLREIDAWRQLKGELTPLGFPAAAEKQFIIKRLKSLGDWQFCWMSTGDVLIVY